MTLNDVEVDSVTKRFEATVAVNKVSVKVTKGELFGLLGPNGAGKSTLTRMISGMINPTSGTIKVAGYDIQHDAQKVKELLGVVPQDVVLYDYLNSRENLAFFGKLYGLSGDRLKKRIEKVLKFTGLDDKAARRHVSTYSGGMKRRVNVAAALLHEPQVILMDEPTVGLDPQNRHALWEIIEGLHKERKTILLTTHLMDEAETLCDRVAIMDKGKIIALDTPHELIKQSKLENTITVVPDRIVPNLLEEVRRIPGIIKAYKAYDKDENAEAVKIVTDHPDEMGPKVVSLMFSMGAKMRSIEYSRVTLEDVFIQLTGRSLREE